MASTRRSRLPRCLRIPCLAVANGTGTDRPTGLLPCDLAGSGRRAAIVVAANRMMIEASDPLQPSLPEPLTRNGFSVILLAHGITTGQASATSLMHVKCGAHVVARNHPSREPRRVQGGYVLAPPGAATRGCWHADRQWAASEW